MYVLDGACLIQPPLFDNSAWTCVLSLPVNKETVALLIGRSRLGILEIEQNTNCAIEVVRNKTRASHIDFSGKNAKDVAKCRELLEHRMKALIYKFKVDATKASNSSIGRSSTRQYSKGSH